jgi:hypothetical protein
MSNSLTSTTISENITKNTTQSLYTILIPQNQELSSKDKVKNWFKKNNKKHTTSFTQFWDKKNKDEKTFYILFAILIGIAAIGSVGAMSYSLTSTGIGTLVTAIGILGLTSVFVVIPLVAVKKILINEPTPKKNSSN